jgi:hypothetical protein
MESGKIITGDGFEFRAAHGLVSVSSYGKLISTDL